MLRKLILAPYWLILKIRHALYDSGIWKVYTCEVPTICVGNLAAGGTGKTPHTEMILRTLLRSDDWAYRNVAVLSRGHKRASGGFQQVTRDGSATFYGDEPLQIKKRFPSVTVAVDRSRIDGCDFLCHPEKLQTSKRARKCKEKDLQKADMILLDDAYQYRTLKAWINIVLVEWKRPLDKDHLLPFGRLRDLPERICFADIIIATKCPAYLEDDAKVEWARHEGINDFDPVTCEGTNKKGSRVKVFFTTISYLNPEPVYPEIGNPRYSYSQKLILFSGIAHDTPLRMFLSDKHKLVRHFNFTDHHKYTRMDIQRIMSAVGKYPTAVVMTTEKDSQRVLDCTSIPDKLKERLFMVPIAVKFLTDEEKEIFDSTLISLLRKFEPEPDKLFYNGK